MRIVTLSCMNDDCGERNHYAVQNVRVLLYNHGVCALSFTCPKCGERTEFGVPDSVALQLDRSGAPTTVVKVPEEVFEWPEPGVPPITESDAGIMERSTQAHFEDCVRRELLEIVDIRDDNARSEG